MSTPRLSKSAKLYQERMLPDDQLTNRLPATRFDFASNLAHTIPMTPPLPLVEAIRREGGFPPDAGLTQRWPRGDAEQS